MSLIEKIDKNRLPRHVAIIMDGNGRWAKAKGKDRSFGHQEGVVSVRKIMDAVTQLGLKYLTLYTFSTENWNRPEEEVQALMSLLVSAIHRETPDMMKKNGMKPVETIIKHYRGFTMPHLVYEITREQYEADQKDSAA